MSSSNSPEKMSYIYNSQLDAFTLYHISNEEHGHDATSPVLPALGHATSGALGTAISKLITYPLDVVITRLQVQRQLQRDSDRPHYDSLVDAILKIYEREGGLPAFYNGVFHETAKGIADSFLFFLAYSYVRQKRLDARDGGRSLPALEELGVGMVAGAFSKFFTTPLQNIVTRKQTAAMLSQGSPTTIPALSSTRDIAWEIKREKGIQGFWSGYSASLVLTLNPSITMLLHKVLLRILVPRAKREDPGARVTFLLAAISKALASTATYPFSLAKTRAQVSSQKPTSTTGDTSEMEKPGKSLPVRVRQRTVFSTILRIAQTEGIWALYQGVGAEVLKGFFSHGITMLMKDRIHTVIISLYYSILQSLQKYPSPEELAKSASESVQNVYEQGREQVSGAYAKSVEAAEGAAEKIKEVVAEGSHQAQDVLEIGKEQASNAYAAGISSGAEAASAVSSTASSTLQSGTDAAAAVTWTAKNAGEAVSEHGRNFLEQGKVVTAEASRKAGDILEKGKETVLDADVRDIDGPDTSIKE
ncbi:hypothetical protein ACN47E_008531 [Coniothyrium glycines]